MPLPQAHRSVTPACWVAAQSKGSTNLPDNCSEVNQKEKPRGDQITSMRQIPSVPEAHRRGRADGKGLRGQVGAGRSSRQGGSATKARGQECAGWHLISPFCQQRDRVRDSQAFAPGHSLVKDKAEIWHPDLAIKN